MEECCMCRGINHLYPIKCPGDHMYCLCCIKGLCISSSPSESLRCPLCRQQPDRRHIKDICQDTGKIKKISEKDLYRDINSRPQVWVYEGRNNGWWYYDYDMQDTLEEAWRDNETYIDCYICGQKVHIDLFNMQQKNYGNNAIRAIKRLNHQEIKTSKILIKGVAGMMC